MFYGEIIPSDTLVKIALLSLKDGDGVVTSKPRAITAWIAYPIVLRECAKNPEDKKCNEHKKDQFAC